MSLHFVSLENEIKNETKDLFPPNGELCVPLVLSEMQYMIKEEKGRLHNNIHKALNMWQYGASIIALEPHAANQYSTSDKKKKTYLNKRETTGYSHSFR